MPELPEVETIRQDLAKAILNKRIASIDIKKPKLIKNKSLDYFLDNTTDQKINSINRIGKLLYIHLSNHKYLLIHLKMTGQLIYQNEQETIAGGHNWPPIDILPNKYSHVIFSFSDNTNLYFNDQRQFGYLKVTNKANLNKIIDDYGIEPLQPNFSQKAFAKIFRNRKTNIKNILLNQKIISGLGNIYVDEILFDSQVLPHSTPDSLSSKQIKQIHLSTEKIIKKAIEHRGTTFSDYKDAKGHSGNYSQQLKVYGRQDKECLVCKKTKIRKTKLAGRGTHFCPNCQK